MDLGGSDWRRMVGRGLGVGGWERVWRGRTEGLGERTEGLGERTEVLGVISRVWTDGERPLIGGR